eukprot:m.82981 g.82981  ORF g.82981 m.82981 type:complete len:279 (+) comp19592_c0_seq1:437-1273(+)
MLSPDCMAPVLTAPQVMEIIDGAEVTSGRVIMSVVADRITHNAAGCDEAIVDTSHHHPDCILECVQLDALVTVGGEMGLGAAAAAAANRSAPIAISPRRTALRPGVEVLSPEAVWNRSSSESPGGFDPRALRFAEFVTRSSPGSPPTDCGDQLYALHYHVEVPLSEPIRLADLPSGHRFLIELQCVRNFPLETEHVLRFATPEIGWISDPDDPELCTWPSSTCYVARQSMTDPFVIVELVLNADGVTTDRVATGIGLPCIPASDILFGAPQWRKRCFF